MLSQSMLRPPDDAKLKAVDKHRIRHIAVLITNLEFVSHCCVHKFLFVDYSAKCLTRLEQSFSTNSIKIGFSALHPRQY